jgi:DNA replication and repair protein RecF
VYLSKETPVGREHRDAMRRRLAETAEKEQWNGQTLVGPHRDDISFVSGSRDLSGFASRGQQRTAILAFKLATPSFSDRPMAARRCLLLDDVFSELDPQRRAHLVGASASCRRRSSRPLRRRPRPRPWLPPQRCGKSLRAS